MTKPAGHVTSVRLRRLKDGSFRHTTQIDFTSGPFKGVKIEGKLNTEDPKGELLAAIQERYDVPGLPSVLGP